MIPPLPPSPSGFAEHLAFWIVVLWTGGTMAVYFFSILNIPFIVSFARHRIVQLRDPKFDLRPTRPNYAGLHYFCAVVYGVLFPAFYFFGARTRHQMGPWHLGAGTNTWWTIALGALCIAWLLSNIIEAILRWDRIRFFPTWTNRVMAGLGVALALRFHLLTLAAAGGNSEQSAFGNDGPARVFFEIIHPQSCFLAATLVYLFAFLETRRQATIARPRGKMVLGGALGAAAALALFAPFWLSLPRVTHRQAMKLLNDNRATIAEVSAEASIDPRLLAGVVYVAQTRDHPRFTGDLIEAVGMRLARNTSIPNFGTDDAPPIDVSAGIAQMKTFPLVRTLLWLDWHIGVAGEAPAKESVSSDWNGRASQWTAISRVSHRHVAEMMHALAGPQVGLPGQSRSDLVPPPFDPNLAARIRPYAQSANAMDYLGRPEIALALAAAMLGYFEHQWRAAGFPIDDKPEIAATLYNLGYERSNPHGAPKANDFGRRVLKFMNSAEAKALFPGAEAGNDK